MPTTADTAIFDSGTAAANAVIVAARSVGGLTLSRSGQFITFDTSAASLAVSGTTSVTQTATITGAGAFSTATLNVSNGNLTFIGGTRTVTGVTTVGSATITGAFSTATLNANTGANLTSAGTRSVSGTTTVNGIVTIADTGTFSTGNLVVNNAANLNLTGGTRTVTGSTTVGSATITGAFSTATLNANTGAILTSAGTRAVSGTTTVDGNVTISGAGEFSTGNLVVNNAANLTLSGAGTVSGRLSGLGTISSSAPLSLGATATHAPGGAAGVVGTQTVTNLDYSTGTIFEWDLSSNSNTAGAYDRVLGGGSGTLDLSGAIFRIVLGNAVTAGNGFWSGTQTWNDIFSGFTNITGSFASIQVQGAGNVPAVGSFSLNGTSLTWSAVPEPSSALAGALLVFGLARRRR